jgi:3-methyl-2-oxobutanoate hydroxymethyltransferase
MMVSPARLFRDAKSHGEPLAMISLYDAPTAALCCDAGADIVLVGDSLGNVILGHDNPVPVTMEDMLRHTVAVMRGVTGSSRPEVPVIVDLPFGSYATVNLAAQNSAALMHADAHALLERATEEFIGEVHSGAFTTPEHAWSVDENELREWESGG